MTLSVATDTQIMREINSAAVLRALRDVNSLSLTELSKATGLSRQATARSLASLETDGLVETLAPNPTSSVGRPAQRVRLRTEAGHVVGVSVGPRELRFVIADLRGESIAHRVVELADKPVIGAIESAITSLLSEVGLKPDDVWWVSVGAPGIVDSETGEIRLIPSMPSLAGEGLLDALRAIFACGITVDNDVKLATEGEQWRVSRSISSLVFVEWGERLGAGIMLNGTLFRGVSNDAGDIGYLNVAMDPLPLASRPGLGPLENWVGGAEIVDLARRAAREEHDDELLLRLEDRRESESLRAVIDAARDGRPSAVAAVTEAARRLASGIAAIRVLLDPELVVIGGAMAACGDVILEAIGEAAAGSVLTQPRLSLSNLGEDAVVTGALHHCLAAIEPRLFSASISELARAPMTF